MLMKNDMRCDANLQDIAAQLPQLQDTITRLTNLLRTCVTQLHQQHRMPSEGMPCRTAPPVSAVGSPASGVSPASPGRRYLTDAEVVALLSAARTGPQGDRNYCLVFLCFIHGFRASELCRLRLSDIDLAGRSLTVRRLKKGFTTRHPLLEAEVQALRIWLVARRHYQGAGSDWLFLSRKGSPLSRQSLYLLVGSLGRQAGLGIAAHPHMLRHACGFALADRGADTRLIQDYLGHRNIRHTVWYTASNAERFRGVWGETCQGYCFA